jgi:hypothetical protein
LRIPLGGKLDTVLVLDKEAAIIQANFNLTHREMRYRFAAALKREEKLMQIWENTSLKIEKQDHQIRNLRELNELLKEEAAIREDETLAIKKTCKKSKRKSFITGVLMGSCVGAITAIILTTR